MRRNIWILITLMLVICSCGRQRRINAFMENEGIRLQVAGSEQFRYNELTCQMAFSRDKNEFRAHTDNMSDFYVVRLNYIPSGIGDKVTAALTWTTATDILHRNNLTLEVVRIEGETMWLWSDSGRIGLSLKILE